MIENGHIMDVSKVVITKLNGENYLIWATQVEALLQARDLWKYIDGSHEEVGNTSADVKKHKSMARAAIICSVETEYVPMIAGTKDPKEMWDMLADSNKSKCTASVHTLRNRLLNIRMDQGMTIRSYVNEICTLERQLAFAGKVVDVDDKKFALLNGLRPEYAVKKVILQESYDMSFEKMVSSLEQTEDELGNTTSGRRSESTSGSSFIADEREHGNKSCCWICEKSGHRMSNCFYNPRSNNYKPSFKPSIKIVANLKKRKIWQADIKKDECEFSFMTLGQHSIMGRWFIDSCASRHLTNQRDNMFDYRTLDDAEFVNAACEGGSVKIVGIGNLRVKQIIDGREVIMMLKDVGYAPKCRTNLVALSKAQRGGMKIEFEPYSTKMIGTYQGSTMMIADSKQIGITELVGMKTVRTGKTPVVFFNAGDDDAMKLAHRRTCHTAVDTLKKMESTNAVVGLNVIRSTKNVGNICEACVDGKAMNKAHHRREKTSSKVLELMHTDLCGSISPMGVGGQSYAQLLTDDYSGAMWVSSMPFKSGVGQATKDMVLHAQKLTGKKLVTLRTDGAKEFTMGGCKKFLDENGSMLDEVPPYSPQSNGRAERPNRTVFEKARTSLSEMNMMGGFDGHEMLWPEAIRCVVHVYNRTLTRSSHKDVRHKTPYEIITGSKPDLSNLRIFGSQVKVLMPDAYRGTKVQPKCWDGYHVGYNPGDAYRCYIPKLKRVFVSKDVTFIEKLYHQPSKVSFDVGNAQGSSSIDMVDDQRQHDDDVDGSHNEHEGSNQDKLPNEDGSNGDPSEDEFDDCQEEHNEEGAKYKPPWISGDFDHEKDNVSRDADVDKDDVNKQDGSNNERKQTRAGRKVRKPSRYDDMTHLAFMTAEALHGNVSDELPSSADEAVRGTNKDKWIIPMRDEIISMLDNGVFDIVEKPQGRKIVSCRWVFAHKKDAEGNIYRYKARLVARGYSQVHGVDYDEVFAPVVRFDTLRFMLAYAAKHNLECKQVDVKTAFLYGDLDEEVFMEIPSLPEEVMSVLSKHGSQDGCKHRQIINMLGRSRKNDGVRHAIKLNRSIYGLKQAAKQWHEKLNMVLCSLGFSVSSSDPCLLLMDDKSKQRTFVLVYVDDIIVVSPTVHGCNKVYAWLKKSFDVGPIEDVHFFLGMKVRRNRDQRKLWLSQEAYVNKIAARFNMEGTSSNVPMRNDIDLVKATTKEFDEASEKPYREMVGSLMYIACTSRPDIMYPTTFLARFVSCYGQQHWMAAKRVISYLVSTKQHGLCYGCDDGNVIGYTDADWAGSKEKRKSTGGFVFVYHGATFAWSSKRQTVVAASSVESEYISQARCVREALWIRKLLHDFNMDDGPVEIRADNQGAIILAQDFKMNARTKHIDVAYHLTRDYVAKNMVRMSYVPSEHMVADGMTKALGRIKHERNAKMFGLVSTDGSMRSN